MVMKVTALRHVISNSLGALETILESVGAEYSYLDTYYEDDLSGFDPLEPDLLVVLGGNPGVYQTEHYPFIKIEIDLLEKRLAAGLPVLGICLGAQMIAKALGADVYVGESGPEIGWHSLQVSEEGKETSIRYFDVEHTNMLQCHGDTFDLPDGATLLASSDNYKNQIFSWGKNTLGLQAHIEVTPRTIKNWMVSVAGDVAKGKFDIQTVRKNTEDYLETLMGQSEKFFLEWLQDIGLEENSA